jgi:ABC-type nitrate/sulfonate/bicarbonate transport system substrate-binding protein
LGAIAAAEDHQVISRKDRGISAPGDLRGKRIGALRGTSMEFFMGRFLTFNDLGLGDVEFLNLQPSDQEEALLTGRVDAVVVPEYWANKIEQRLGDKIISWPAQGGQKFYWLLMSTDDLPKPGPISYNECLKRCIRQKNS